MKTPVPNVLAARYASDAMVEIWSAERKIVLERRLWIAVRFSLRSVVENVTLADLAAGKLPAKIDRMAEDPEAWETR